LLSGVVTQQHVKENLLLLLGRMVATAVKVPSNKKKKRRNFEIDP
jgi:hypothetical protein